MMTATWYTRFNVFDDVAPLEKYHGAPAHIKVVHQAPDGRHVTLYSDHPDGVEFTQPPAGLGESFYIIEGTVRCRTTDGETTTFRAGDLVHWSYSEPLELQYSSDLRSVCFFWSDEPLGDLARGAEIT